MKETTDFIGGKENGKMVYVTPEMEIIEFETEDVITTSDSSSSKPGGGIDEGGIY